MARWCRYLRATRAWSSAGVGATATRASVALTQPVPIPLYLRPKGSTSVLPLCDVDHGVSVVNAHVLVQNNIADFAKGIAKSVSAEIVPAARPWQVV